jgi:hypothetical protein
MHPIVRIASTVFRYGTKVLNPALNQVKVSPFVLNPILNQVKVSLPNSNLIFANALCTTRKNNISHLCDGDDGGPDYTIEVISSKIEYYKSMISHYEKVLRNLGDDLAYEIKSAEGLIEDYEEVVNKYRKELSASEEELLKLKSGKKVEKKKRFYELEEYPELRERAEKMWKDIGMGERLVNRGLIAKRIVDHLLEEVSSERKHKEINTSVVPSKNIEINDKAFCDLLIDRMNCSIGA